MAVLLARIVCQSIKQFCYKQMPPPLCRSLHTFSLTLCACVYVCVCVCVLSLLLCALFCLFSLFSCRNFRPRLQLVAKNMQGSKSKTGFQRSSTCLACCWVPVAASCVYVYVCMYGHGATVRLD